MDIQKIRNDYITTNISLRSLAEKYGMSYSTVRRMAIREDWKSQRSEDSAMPEPLPDVQKRVDAIADRLLDKLAQAVEELDSAETVTRTKSKTQDGECTTERRYFEPGGNISCKDLKVLTAALKDIKDLRHLRSPADAREQEAKIRNLERQFTQQGSTEIVVRLEGETEGFGE